MKRLLRNALVSIAMMLQAVLSLGVHRYLCATPTDGLIELSLTTTCVVILTLYYTLTVSLGILVIKTIMQFTPTKHDALPVLPALVIFLGFVLLVFVPLVTLGILVVQSSKSLRLSLYRYVVWSHYIVSGLVQVLSVYLLWISSVGVSNSILTPRFLI